MTDPVPGYDELVTRNAIAALTVPGDLTLRNGDIAMTRWGDLMLNSADYSAFVRLLQTWRYNFPAIADQFRAWCRTFDDAADAEKQLNSMGGKPWNPALGLLQGLDVDAYHACNDRLAAAEAGRGAFAATLTLFTSRILATFRGDISATRDEWRTAGTLLQGCSFGEVVEAAANNVRHADEWITASPATGQQLKSVRILSAVLQTPIPPDGRIRAFAGDVSSIILDLITNRDFLRFERTMFDFASALLVLREKRVASA